VKSHILIEELERHRQAHLHQLSTYREIEQQHFQNYQQLPMPEKLQYLTLRRGIRYETDSIVWCEEAIQLLRESEHN
jgi:hypothetical protein